MAAEFFERAAFSDKASVPSKVLKLKPTPICLLPNFSVVSALCPSSPPSLSTGLFQSLLFEASGRTVNPVNRAVGLLWTGNRHICESAVETVLRDGSINPMPDLFLFGSTQVRYLIQVPTIIL
ncbi:unnamed protein product [Lactuca saligna]|uniref:Uncharacterized protein n=1 Tax=Lactuca saligna TaxID=75948 RepID=A0AA35ZIA7_LACSI|nr:unnamed protein product [Lactuca saligna]